VVVVGLDHAPIPFGGVNDSFQFLLAVVSCFGMDAVQAGLGADGNGLHVTQVALLDHGQDVGTIKGRFVADGFAIQAIRRGRDLEHEGIG